jgi:medium-chain acyl-[acyl-carrier-protein] hydrolase
VEVLENPKLFELISPILRADFELMETYTYAPRSRLQCPITVLDGIRDKDIIRRDLEAWREHAAGPFSMHMFPGNHFFLNSHQKLVLQTIAGTLACSR